MNFFYLVWNWTTNWQIRKRHILIRCRTKCQSNQLQVLLGYLLIRLCKYHLYWLFSNRMMLKRSWACPEQVLQNPTSPMAPNCCKVLSMKAWYVINIYSANQNTNQFDYFRSLKISSQCCWLVIISNLTLNLEGIKTAAWETLVILSGTQLQVMSSFGLPPLLVWDTRLKPCTLMMVPHLPTDLTTCPASSIQAPL